MFFAQRSNQLEILDEDTVSAAELAGNLRDIVRINRYFGGRRVILKQLARVLAQHRELGRERRLRLLDVATGAADIPVEIAGWAARRQLRIEITALDYSGPMLQLAGRQIAQRPIGLVRGDARRLPYGDGSFDIVTCSLALHHFRDDEALLVLRELRRVARHAVIVNDLRRSLLGYLAAHAYGLVLTRNRITRNDGPLSILRAFTPAELARLAARAEIGPHTITCHPGWRLSLLCL